MTADPIHLFEGYGIELEYMIVSGDSLDIFPSSDRILHAVSGTYESEIEMGPLNWSNELVLHVIELKTNGPAANLATLPELFQDDVRRIDAILDEMGGRLLPTAMHPWMDPHAETKLWPHGYSSVYESYNRIFGCSGHGWSNLQSMHINLPFSGDDEFGRLHAAIRLILPLLPALAASSPVVEGKASGLMDTRLEFYRNNQKKIPSLTAAVIPEPVYTQRDYEDTIFRRIYADIAPHDEQGILRHEWLNSRGAIARFDRDTIEIRVIDIQECPLADLAVASAVDALVRAHASERWAGCAAQQAFPNEALAGIFLDTVRNGDRAVIDNDAFLTMYGLGGIGTVTAGEFWRRLYESAVEPYVEGCFRPPLETILERGPLSRRILDALGGDVSRDSLHSCYRELMDCLHEGTMFRA